MSINIEEHKHLKVVLICFYLYNWRVIKMAKKEISSEIDVTENPAYNNKWQLPKKHRDVA